MRLAIFALLARALFVVGVILLVSGCSASSLLTGLSDKPEVTAQVGKENVKQTVGITAKSDTTSHQKTTVKDSKVKEVDTSSKKKVSTASITASEIKAEKIEVHNGADDLPDVLWGAGCMYLAGILTALIFRRNKKGA